MIPNGRVIGVDLGTRRIGVAVCDSSQILAIGVAVLERAGDRDEDHRRLRAIAEEYGAVGMVVGVPYSLSGRLGQMADAVMKEVGQLGSAMGIPVETVDERFTTTLADAGLRGAAPGRISGHARRRVVDRHAAAEILQTWLERRKVPA